MSDDKNNKRGKGISQLHVSEETRNYFSGLAKYAKQFELHRRRVRKDSGTGQLGVDIPSTFAGSIIPIPIRPYVSTTDDNVDSNTVNTGSCYDGKAPKTLGRVRTYRRGNKNK